MKDKLKVAEIIRSAEGGMKTHFMDLCTEMVQKGLEVDAFCAFDNHSHTQLEQIGVTVHEYRLSGSVNPIKDLFSLYRLVRILRIEKIHIVHCHGFKAGLVGRVAARLLGLPSLYTVHNFILYKGHPLFKKVIAYVERFLSSGSCEIIAVSRALKENMMEKTSIPHEKIHVIYNGIRMHGKGDGALVRAQFGLESSNILVGTTARLIPSKGLDTLMQAAVQICRQHKEIRFMIVGSGPEEDRLKKAASSLGISDRVIFAGYRENIWDFYDAFDLFVLPTLSEGLGLSVLEAMAAGKPVITSATGGILEIVRHRENGWLVAPGDKKAIIDAVVHLAANAQEAYAYGRQGQEDIKDTFDMNKMVSETVAMLLFLSNPAVLTYNEGSIVRDDK